MVALAKWIAVLVTGAEFAWSIIDIVLLSTLGPTTCAPSLEEVQFILGAVSFSAAFVSLLVVVVCNTEDKSFAGALKALCNMSMVLFGVTMGSFLMSQDACNHVAFSNVAYVISIAGIFIHPTLAVAYTYAAYCIPKQLQQPSADAVVLEEVN